jgi:hypothetical protein
MILAVVSRAYVNAAERPTERRTDATPAIAAIVRIDGEPAMAQAMVDDVAVKRDAAVDVRRCVLWCVPLAPLAVPLAAANRGVGMGRERAAMDRRAGAKCTPAAAKSAASTAAARRYSIGGNREDDNRAQCQERVTLKERFGRHVWLSSAGAFLA